MNWFINLSNQFSFYSQTRNFKIIYDEKYIKKKKYFKILFFYFLIKKHSVLTDIGSYEEGKRRDKTL